MKIKNLFLMALLAMLVGGCNSQVQNDAKMSVVFEKAFGRGIRIWHIDFDQSIVMTTNRVFYVEQNHFGNITRLDEITAFIRYRE